MRIISGKYGGLQLAGFNADHIRPTTDRVKESLFNIWKSNIESASCLDLFCGTGSLGLEALSRGASSVLFVDESQKSLDILRKNIQTLKLTEPHEIQKQEALKFLTGFNREPFDLIFIDPPFTKEMADEVLAALSRSKAFSEKTLISIESGRREKIQEDYGAIIRYDQRAFGDKVLSFFCAKR